MLENFIYAKEKSLFEEALNNGEVLDEAIAFIEDTKEIWTHGSYFSNLNDVLKITEQSLTEEQKAQVKANLGITKDVVIGDTVPPILPDLFVDTSRNYEDSLNSLIEDAPADGKQYARKDKSWSEIEAIGGESSKINFLPELADIHYSIIRYKEESIAQELYDALSEYYQKNETYDKRSQYSEKFAIAYYLHEYGCFICKIKKDGDYGFRITTKNLHNNSDIAIEEYSVYISSDLSAYISDSKNNNGIPRLEPNGEPISVYVEDEYGNPLYKDVIEAFASAASSEISFETYISGYYVIPIIFPNKYNGERESEVLLRVVRNSISSSSYYSSTIIASCHLFGGYDLYITTGISGRYTWKKVRKDSHLYSYDGYYGPFDNYVEQAPLFEGLTRESEWIIDKFKNGNIVDEYSGQDNKNAYRREYTNDDYDISFDVIGQNELVIYDAKRTRRICRVNKNGIVEAELLAPSDETSTYFDMYELCGCVYLKAQSNNITIVNPYNVTKTATVIIENNEASNITTSVNGIQISINSGEKIVLEVTSTHKDIFISKKYVN